MRHTSIFRLLAMTTIWFFCAALAQAGQVITHEDRAWAKKALEQEEALGAISTSNSIAVLYFNNKSGLAKLNPLQKGLAVMLITDLAKVEQIQVVERVRMQALLDEMDLGASGLVDVKTAPKVGNLLGAYYVTSGDILDGKIRDLEIDSSLLDVPFETVARQPTTAGALDELFKLEKEILFNIIDQMKVSISPKKRAELEKPLSASTAALLALFLGLDYSDKGEYAEAANMYEQALIEDPNLELAKSALQELKDMGLIATEEIAAAAPSEAVINAMKEGATPAQIIEEELKLEKLNPVQLIQALCCAGASWPDVEQAARDADISELAISTGKKKSLAECGEVVDDTQAYTPPPMVTPTFATSVGNGGSSVSPSSF